MNTISKKEAIKLMNGHYDRPVLNYKNTCFSNINSSKDVWWFDISLQRISKSEVINILVYDYKTNSIYHLIVPTHYFNENRNKFAIREDRACVSIELSCDETNKFQDIRPTSGRMKFSEFLKAECCL